MLYAWHILPLALYAKHEPSLIAQTTGLSPNITQTLPFKLLSQNPETRLVISCPALPSPPLLPKSTSLLD